MASTRRRDGEREKSEENQIKIKNYGSECLLLAKPPEE